MTVTVPDKDDLPRRDRRVEGDRTQGVVARVDAQLRQHRHPDPSGNQRVDGGAVIAARGDPRSRRARQALASVVRWPYLPEVDQRQVDEITGRHAVAPPNGPSAWASTR